MLSSHRLRGGGRGGRGGCMAGVWQACVWLAGGRRAGVAGVALSVAATVARLSFIFSILNESSARVVYSQ